jgi:hypothetical protein
VKLKTDNKTMKVTGGEYFTVQDMSSILGESTNTINKRLFRLGIKPISKDALYPISALDAISDIKMGRPKKSETKTISKAKPAKQKK